MTNYIYILLSVYNGEKYLEEQLYSIFKQSYKNIHLLIRDDGSQDKSVEIIEKHSQEHENMTVILGHNIGIVQSFNKLIARFNLVTKREDNYLMFCDQDDVWLNDKVEKSICFLQKEEKLHSQDMPIMLYSDLCITDHNLSIVSKSFFDFQNISANETRLERLLGQNRASGCTIIANRALVALAGQIPEQACMHDHWYSLVAASFGKMIFLNEATLLYRQHSCNVMGASAYGWSYFYRRYISGVDNIRKRFYQNVNQAQVFLQQYRNLLNLDQIEMLEKFSRLQKMSWLKKRTTLIKYKIFKYGWRRNIGTMLII